jgi:hypothetical protein
MLPLVLYKCNIVSCARPLKIEVPADDPKATYDSLPQWPPHCCSLHSLCTPSPLLRTAADTLARPHPIGRSQPTRRCHILEFGRDDSAYELLSGISPDARRPQADEAH